MDSKKKIILMLMITCLVVIMLPIALILIDAHIIAKLCWTLLALIDIVVFVSTCQSIKGKQKVELFTKQGLYLTVGSLFLFSLILTIVLAVTIS